MPAFLYASGAIICGHCVDAKRPKTLGETMAGEVEVQVSHFLDEHGVGAFQIKLIFWSILIALIDGYDIGAIAFAAPSLIREWHVAPKDLGLVLSASNIGVLFGSQIFGWIGDNYGRKTALIATNLLFGVFTFAASYATDLTQLSWLRFIAGLGIGGVIPNVVAINAESAPRNLRATLAIIAVGTVPMGGADLWLADPVPDRRHRSDRLRARRHLRLAGIDQIHDAP
jgi:MFS transporter, AAHS family, 4-hydroxybenzoate transporter